PLEEPPELRLLLREEAPALLVRLGPRVGGIGAGREDGRSAGDDHHARRVVVSELREGPRQVREHGVAQRVPALRPAERYRGHGPPWRCRRPRGRARDPAPRSRGPPAAIDRSARTLAERAMTTAASTAAGRGARRGGIRSPRWS